MPSLEPVSHASLANAVIAASGVPLLLLDSTLSVITASRSFSTVYEIDPANVAGCPLAEVGSGEWSKPQLKSLLLATLSGGAKIDAYEMDLQRPGKPDRLLILNAQLLDYADADSPRLLLAIADITLVRESERLEKIRDEEKQILRQELQHRVANSLQIIASVLMQSARRVQSDETRGHLRDAHHRVLSVAAVQAHLAASRIGDVQLKSYMTDLCSSIAASMIHDPAQLSLDVDVDDSMASPDMSMSLGLVVTELVINALKHGFPEGREGRIIVRYRGDAGGWTLSVSDDGVGMPPVPDKPTGLGTSIIEALARKLKAHVVIGPSKVGTTVSLCHS